MMTVRFGMTARDNPLADQSIAGDASVVTLASRGAAHLLIRQTLISLVSLGGILALTGLLDPAEFALYGYAATVALLAPAVGDLGLGAGLIRNEGLADRHIEGSFALLFVFWVPICALGAALGSVLGVYGFSTATLLSLWGALLLLSLQTMPTALLERRMRFGGIAVIEVVQRLVFMAVAVTLAATDPSQWSVPVALLVASAISFPAMLIAARWRWWPRLHRGEPLFRGFSSEWWQARVASQLSYAAYPLLGGVLFTAREVGLLVWALAVTSIPGLLAPMVARVAFPAMSRTDPDGQVGVFRPLFRALIFVGLPLVAATLACAEPLTANVLGTKWLDGVSLLRLESVTTACGIALTPLLPLLFLALPPRGVKWMMVSMTLSIVVLAIALSPLASYRSISIAGIVTGVAILSATEIQLRRARGYSMLHDLAPGLVGLVVASAIGLALAGWPGTAAETFALLAAVALIQAGVTALLGGGVDPRALLRRGREEVAVPAAAVIPAPGP
jgi:O-antigen/teichoic acid export membrane protein